MSKDGFRSLKVWQLAKSMAVSVYKITEEGKIGRDFGLRDQMRRAGVSVLSNIAEGDERNTDKEAVRFFYIAKGSLAELISQMEIAVEIGYLSPDQVEVLSKDTERIGRMLGSLIKARSIKT